MDRAKRLIRRLRGKKKYVSSPTGSLPPSPMPGSPIPGENKNRTGIKLRRGKSLNLNRMWRRCIYVLNTIVNVDSYKQVSRNKLLISVVLNFKVMPGPS